MSDGAVKPLLVLGDRRREALESRVAQALARWRAAWSGQAAESFALEAQEYGGEPHAGLIAGAATHCWASGGENVDAVLLLPNASLSWAVSSSAGTSLGSEVTLSDTPAESCLASLEHELVGTLFREVLGGSTGGSGPRRLSPGDVDGWARDARCWRLQAQGAGSIRGFTLLLSASAIDALLPRPRLEKASLEPRRAAVGDDRVALRAVLGDTAVSVSDLAQLAVDDVILLDQSLTDSLRLVSARSGAAVAAAQLGRAGPRRAVKLTTFVSEQVNS
jgi:hypothetical protein